MGIRAPIYETMPLAVSPRMLLRLVEGDLVATEILDAAKAGDTRSLDMHLGPIHHITGEIKARAVIDAVKEEFDGGLDKIVLAYWHKDVGAILRDGLSTYGVVGIDGSTSPDKRERATESFGRPDGARVLLADRGGRRGHRSQRLGRPVFCRSGFLSEIDAADVAPHHQPHAGPPSARCPGLRARRIYRRSAPRNLAQTVGKHP